jgi:hypothetical protein
VHHAVAVAQIVFDVRLVLILRAGEHVHPDAAPPQFAGQVAHVYVHPTCIFAAQGRQRAGVIGEHGDAHGRHYHTEAVSCQRLFGQV